MPDDQRHDAADYRPKFYERYHLARASLQRDSVVVMQHMKELWRKWLPTDRSATLLDLGCGNGEFLQLLNSLGYANVAGVDLSEEQAASGRSKGLNVTAGDAFEYLANRHQEFDLISAFNFFEHLQKKEVLRLLELVHNALRPGGKLLAVTPNGLSPFSGTTRYFDFSHEMSFTPQSWRQLANLSGFWEPVFEEARFEGRGLKAVIRTILWSLLRFGFDSISRIETGHSRDKSRVYTADMKVILTKC